MRNQQSLEQKGLGEKNRIGLKNIIANLEGKTLNFFLKKLNEVNKENVYAKKEVNDKKEVNKVNKEKVNNKPQGDSNNLDGSYVFEPTIEDETRYKAVKSTTNVANNLIENPVFLEKLSNFV